MKKLNRAMGRAAGAVRRVGGAAAAAFSSFRKPDELAYSTSRWSNFLYEDRKDRSGIDQHLSTIRAAISRADLDANPATGDRNAKRQREDSAYEEARVGAAALGREVFGRLYGNPDQVDDPVPWAAAVNQMIDQIPEWQGLAARLNSDPDLSMIATRSAMESIKDRVYDVIAKAKEEEEKDQGDPDNPEETEGERSRRIADKVASSRAGAGFRSAVRRAAGKASGDVAMVKAGLGGMGCGMGSAPEAHEVEDKARYEMAEMLYNNPNFGKVLEKVGRLRRLATADTVKKSKHGNSEVVGLTRGNDLGRVLPTAFAMLGERDLEPIFFKAYAERTLPQYKLQGEEKEGRGPLVCLVDVSGSMYGEPMQYAMAVSIATAVQARADGRPYAVAFFDHRIKAAYVVTPEGDAFHAHRGAASMAKLEQVDGEEFHRYDPTSYRSNPVEGGFPSLIQRFLTTRADGGTCFDPPLRWGLHFILGHSQEAFGKADMVIVTDGYADADAKTRTLLSAFKDTGGRLFGLTVGGGSMGGGFVEECCDTVLDLDRAQDPAAQAAGMLGMRK